MIGEQLVDVVVGGHIGFSAISAGTFIFLDSA